MTGAELLDSVGQLLGEKLLAKTDFRGETTFTIPPNDLREIAKLCRDDLSFDYLLDITSIDNFGEEPRFEIVYHLYSMPHAAHLRLKLKLSEEVGALDTVSDIWPTANWHEREMQELFLVEAAKYDVFPLDNTVIQRLLAARPSATAGRDVFTYAGKVSGIDVADAPFDEGLCIRAVRLEVEQF